MPYKAIITLKKYFVCIAVLLVLAAAVQNIIVAASKGVFYLSVQRTMTLIFVEIVMSFRAKKH